jgi:membrane-bound lytic murein transglycosylase A
MSGAQMNQPAPQVERGQGESILRQISFSDISGWPDDDHAAALATFVVSARAITGSSPKTRALGIEGTKLQAIARKLLADPAIADREATRTYFEKNFTPFRIEAKGFVTGYFEPEVEASRQRTDRFHVPLYRRPSDLVEVSETNRPANWDPEIRFAKKTASGIEPYFDRAEIEDGALKGLGLELAFVRDPIDAFFIHVQGSARLKLVEGPDRGTTLRIAFDGKSGHPYTSIGRLLVERKILTVEKADKDGLETWLKRHADEAQAVLQENRSFIFFRETKGLGPGDGPLGAAGVPLSPLRSLAVDRTLHTFHTPIFVEAVGLADPEKGTTYQRLMIAQDTGSAIIGPARGDIFFGSGNVAGSAAGRVRHEARLVALVPRSSPSTAWEI